jgi:hypothetical protein
MSGVDVFACRAGRDGVDGAAGLGRGGGGLDDPLNQQLRARNPTQESMLTQNKISQI